MKKYIIIVFLLLLTASIFSETILKLDDAEGDDFGSGKIVYPDNPMFDERIFDILSFEVEDDTENYIFKISVAGKVIPVEHAEFQYSYDLPDDFILPLIHIYIDKDHTKDSGFTETIYGTNVVIDPENAWETVIVLASMPERYYGELVRIQPEFARSSIIPEKLILSRSKKEISVKIPKEYLGEITEDWGFTVLMMSQDFSQTIRKNVYVREVNAAASQYNFGGGDSGLLTDLDPNVIDLIVPLGKDQKFELNSYNKEDKALAVLHAVYPNISVLKGAALTGEVKQVSDEKVVVDLGSEHGVVVGTELIIDNKIVVRAIDVFPQLTIASYIDEYAWENISEGMKVTILQK